jgi:hypothetical protein
VHELCDPSWVPDGITSIFDELDATASGLVKVVIS